VTPAANAEGANAEARKSEPMTRTAHCLIEVLREFMFDGFESILMFRGTSGDEVELELDATISRRAFDVSITAIQIFGPRTAS
jgi:hypothetical protein